MTKLLTSANSRAFGFGVVVNPYNQSGNTMN